MGASLLVSQQIGESRPKSPSAQLLMEETSGEFSDNPLTAEVVKAYDVANLENPVSDMSELPSEPGLGYSRGPRDLELHVDQTTKFNFITRPESAGNDIDGSFHMLPPKYTSLKQPKRGTVLNVTYPIQLEVAMKDIQQPLESSNVQSCEETANQGLYEVKPPKFSGLPPRCIGNPLWQSQSEENTVDKDLMEQGSSSATTPLAMQRSGRDSQDSSGSVKPIEDQSQGRQSAPDIQPSAEVNLIDRLMASETVPDRSDEPRAESVNCNIQTVKPTPTSVRKKHFMQEGEENRHVQIPQSDSYRVSKPKLMPLYFQKGPVQKAHTEGTATSITGPSEQDLLYYLMYQTRQRDQNNASCIQQQMRLDKENKSLHDVQETLQKKLEDVIDERDQIVDENEHVRKELDSFKNKYKKLKTWALEMNNEYATIRQEGRVLKASLIGLREESSNIWKPVQETLATNNAAIETIETLKQSLTETKQSAVVLNSDLKLAHEDLASAKAEVCILKDTRAKYEVHIKELSVSQDELSLRITSHQLELVEALNILSQQFNSIEPRQAGLTDLSECLDLVRSLSGRNLATSAGFDDVKTTVNMLSEQLQALSTSLENNLQVSRSCTASDSLAAELVSVINAIKELQPDKMKLESVLHENIRLQERTQSDTAVRQLIEEAKRTAESRQAMVERNNEKLIESLTQKGENQQKHLNITASELRTQLSTMTTRWMNASSELEANKSKASLQEQELNNLRQRLQDCEKQHIFAERELRSRHEQNNELIRDRNATDIANLRAEFEQQISELRESAATSLQAVENIQRAKDSTQNELDQLIVDAGNLHQSLQLAELESGKLTADLESQTQLILNLKQKYREACEKIDQIPALKENIAEHCKTIDGLEASIKKFNGIQTQLDIAQASSASKDITITQLNDKVEKVDQMTRKNAELGQTVVQQQEKLALQTERLATAEGRALALQQCEAIVKRNNMIELDRVSRSLEEAQKQCDKLQEAERKATQLGKDIDKLQAELELANGRGLRVSTLEELIRQRNEKITDLEEQVSNLGGLKDSFEATERCLVDNHKQLDVQVQGIQVPKGQVQQQNQWQTQGQGDDLDELFTQNTDLSMNTFLIPGSQDTNNRDAQESLIATQVPIPSLLGVDPRVTMVATSMGQSTSLPTATQNSSSQTSIIPDSQLDTAAQLYSDSPNRRKKPLNARSTSPLTDLDDKHFDADIEIVDSCPKHIPTTNINFEEAEQDHIFDFPLSSPQVPARTRTSKNLPHRPSSTLSQEEMLLQASEIGRRNSPRAMRAQQAHPRIKPIASRAGSMQPRSEQADAIDSDRYPLRRSSQSQTPDGQRSLLTSDTHNRRAVSRERALPNSAAKRRVDEVAGDVDERYVVKRPKLNTALAGSKSSGKLRRTSIALLTPRSADNLPTGSRSGESPEHIVSMATKSGRRSKSVRKQSKQTRYTEKFGNGSQS